MDQLVNFGVLLAIDKTDTTPHMTLDNRQWFRRVTPGLWAQRSHSPLLSISVAYTRMSLLYRQLRIAGIGSSSIPTNYMLYNS